MKYYVEAFDHNCKEILGNLDGQGVINAKQYRRTNFYKSLHTRKTLNNRVYKYHIVTESDRTVEIVYNENFIPK